MAFCEEHTDVVRSLGRVEQRLEDGQQTMEGISEKLDTISVKIHYNGVTHASEMAYTKLFYWVLTVAGAGLIGALVMNLTKRWFEH